MDKNTPAETQDIANEVGKIVTVVADIADDEKVDVAKVGGLAARVASFLIHCFGCNNPPKTPALLKKDSVRVRRCRNAYQVTGQCSKCGRSTTGFIPSSAAQQYEVEPDPVSPEERAARLAEKKRKREAEPDGVKKRRVRKPKVLAVDGAIVPVPAPVPALEPAPEAKKDDAPAK